jgi:hypothetical protein
MHLFPNSKTVLACAFSSTLTLLSAATPGIGVAMSQGNILINSAQSAGNATVFSGNTLETGTSASQVRLTGGAELRLATDSRGTVFADHVDLDRGSARIAGYSANAKGLSVRAEGSSSASITMREGVVQIAALTGNVHVFNAAGINVANLLPGRALDLTPQDAGASAPSSLLGCAVKSGSNTLFTDEGTKVTVQLRGSSVKAGKRVQIKGSMVPNATPATGATQVINVTSVKSVGGPCKSAAAIAAGAGAAGAAGGAAAGAAGAGAAAAGAGAAAGAAGAATAAGISAGVIGGVAAAGAAAVGIGVGVAKANDSGSTSSGRVGAFN